MPISMHTTTDTVIARTHQDEFTEVTKTTQIIFLRFRVNTAVIYTDAHEFCQWRMYEGTIEQLKSSKFQDSSRE